MTAHECVWFGFCDRFYDPEQKRKEIGTITGFRPVPVRHAGNHIMNRHWRINKHGIQDLADRAVSDQGAPIVVAP